MDSREREALVQQDLKFNLSVQLRTKKKRSYPSPSPTKAVHTQLRNEVIQVSTLKNDLKVQYLYNNVGKSELS